MNDIIKLTYQRDGEEIKTMEFDEIDVFGNTAFNDKYKLWASQFKYHLRLKGEYSRGVNKDDILSSLNPLYLERITQEECPYCKGVGFY